MATAKADHNNKATILQIYFRPDSNRHELPVADKPKMLKIKDFHALKLSKLFLSC